MSAPASVSQRFAALGEVMFCLVAANMLIVLLRIAGFTPALFGVVGEPAIDARTGLVDGLFVFLKFAAMLAIGLLLFRRCHGLRPVDVGFSRGGHGWPALIGRGIVLGAVAMLPWLVLVSANAVLGFGEGVAGWQRIEDAPLTAGYVVFVLAAMVVIPPLMEESAFRGYVRGRLHLAFGPVGAALVSAVIFVFAHGHFYGLDAVLVGTQITFVFASTALAYDTWRSGSLVPAIIAHAMLNLPFGRDGPQVFGVLALAIVILVVARAPVLEGLRQFGRDWAATTAKGVVLLFVLLAAALMISTMLYLPSAALLILVAVAGAFMSCRLRV